MLAEIEYRAKSAEGKERYAKDICNCSITFAGCAWISVGPEEEPNAYSGSCGAVRRLGRLSAPIFEPIVLLCLLARVVGSILATQQ